MLVIYATVTADGAMIVNNERLNIKLDDWLLDNKIIVMDQEYYDNYSHDYSEDLRIIVVSKNNVAKSGDVEYYENIYKLANAKFFKDKELYIIGSSELIKEAIPICDRMELNIVDKFLGEYDQVNMKFPNYDEHNWQNGLGNIMTPRITRVVLDRVAPYSVKKRIKK